VLHDDDDDDDDELGQHLLLLTVYLLLIHCRLSIKRYIIYAVERVLLNNLRMNHCYCTTNEMLHFLSYTIEDLSQPTPLRKSEDLYDESAVARLNELRYLFLQFLTAAESTTRRYGMMVCRREVTQQRMGR
jgi:hypothetical protein